MLGLSIHPKWTSRDLGRPRGASSVGLDRPGLTGDRRSAPWVSGLFKLVLTEGDGRDDTRRWSTPTEEAKMERRTPLDPSGVEEGPVKGVDSLLPWEVCSDSEEGRPFGGRLDPGTETV